MQTPLKAVSDQAVGLLAAYYRKAQCQLELLAAEAGFASDEPRACIFKAAASTRGEKALRMMQRFLQRNGQPEQWLDAARLEQVTGSGYYRAGLQLSGNTLVNPRQLVRALVKQLPDNIALFEHSPVTALERCASGWQLQTAEGSVSAAKVVLANNAFIKGLGLAASRSVTIYTYAGVTSPLADQERRQVMGSGPWGLLPAHRLGSTFRTTEDGRLLVRGMYSYEQEGGNEVAEVLQASLSKRYPSLSGAQTLEHWWGGATSLTSNGAPVWGELQPGLFASVGCNGVGIVKGWFLGQALADLICGRPVADISALFGKAGWMPPEPFRKLGFLAVSSVERNLAGAEI
ncbi:hypothetical protein BTA35_0200120 [Oceanospirillum linum]|uniref:FAD dependent oxidoreductase domain-containing protein n=1 Tax=Oceanospirillum linum TaxID=966 RepID=A0A1T1HDV9_OCELI|nr:FAD-dependent oxidoreductase [Oceanospirillum linum]OOV88005.1 hypothetical protein BTA35_0200120 [Oceanospirillum linum]SEF40175.1 Glycine/D-amino acid oxidase [Oleiphilus messinensis]SMP00437.1 Glycine/D-amino acid oxidase [Oceanospirillum linum]